MGKISLPVKPKRLVTVSPAWAPKPKRQAKATERILGDQFIFDISQWRLGCYNKLQNPTPKHQISSNLQIPSPRAIPKALTSLFTQQMHDYLPVARLGAVFPNIDALPSAKNHMSAIHRNAEIDGGK